MPQDRPNERHGEAVPQLVARRQYNVAIDVLRARLQRERPDPRTRLRLADLLIQAGRTPEAVPILLSLSDDFARKGFFAKAAGVLKRVEQVRPGLHDIEGRLARLAALRDASITSSLAPGDSRAASPAIEPGPTAVTSPPPAAPVSEPEAEVEEGEAGPRWRGLLGRWLGGTPEPARPRAPKATGPRTRPPTPPPAVSKAELELDASTFLRPAKPEAPATAVAVPAEAPVPSSTIATEPDTQAEALEPPPPTRPEVAARAAVDEPASLPSTVEPPVAQAPAEPTGEPMTTEAPQESEAIEAAVTPLGTDRAAEAATDLESSPGPIAESEPPSETAEPARLPEVDAVLPKAELPDPERPATPGPTGSAPERTAEVLPSGLRSLLGRLFGKRREEPGTLAAPEPAPVLESAPEEPKVAAPPAVDPVSAPKTPPAAEVTATPEPRTAGAVASTTSPTEANNNSQADATSAEDLPMLAADQEAEPPRHAEPEAVGADPEHVSTDDDLPMLAADAAPEAEAAPVAPTPEPVAARDAVPAASEPEHASPHAVTAEAGAVPEEPSLSEDAFHARVLDIVEEALREPLEITPAVAVTGEVDLRRLKASQLFSELDERELASLLPELRQHIVEPGDIVLTEGEGGETLFVLARGSVKVFVRNPQSRNIEVRELEPGDFFGEVGVLSGQPRTATIVASAPTELVELSRPTLERLGRAHPGIVDTLEAYYLVRTQSEAVATLRGATINDAEMQRRAAEVLRAHFGETNWDPRMRLKLADALLKAGKQQEALPVLVGLADELARRGFTERAVAILKRIERIQGRHTEEIALAPLPKKKVATESPAGSAHSRNNPAGFQGWLLDLVRESAGHGAGQRGAGTAPGLMMSPLFEDFAEDELLALMRAAKHVEHGPGDIVVSEGEPGKSVFVLTNGVAKVFVRTPQGRNVSVGRLCEGDFFGEIALLSGRARSATITASGPCELLELDESTLDRICASHPRVRAIMEESYIERASDPLAARLRSMPNA